jgi:trigger factor
MSNATAELKPEVKVEDAGPAKKRITVTVQAKDVDARLENGFGNLAGEAALPGFRKGKAPRALLERRFGDMLLKETRSQLLGETYGKVVQDHKLRPVGEPSLPDGATEPTLTRGKAFTYTVEVEVAPDFAAPKTDGLAIQKPMFEIKDEHVAAEIRRQGFRFGTPERITGPFRPLDRMLCTAKAWKNGEQDPFFNMEKALVVVPDTVDEGKGSLLGILVNDLSKHLEGRKVGESVTIDTVAPENHEREDLRGAKIRFELKFDDADRITPLDAPTLADRMGLETEENLRTQVRMVLERKRDAEQRAAEREQVSRHLADAIDFPLPERLSQAQIARNLEMARMEMLQRGMEAEEVETRLAELRHGSEEDTKRRLKLFFILSRLAEEMGVQVNEPEVNGRIAAMAAQRGVPPAQMRQDLERAGRLSELTLSIREQKVLDRILDRATFTEIDADAWNKAEDKRRDEAMAKARSSKGGSKKKA